MQTKTTCAVAQRVLVPIGLLFYMLLAIASVRNCSGKGAIQSEGVPPATREVLFLDFESRVNDPNKTYTEKDVLVCTSENEGKYVLLLRAENNEHFVRKVVVEV